MSEHRRHLAWKAGDKARRAGKPLEANDRQRGTIFADDWHDGWMAADAELWRERLPNTQEGRG